jgi:hypothetical protein
VAANNTVNNCYIDEKLVQSFTGHPTLKDGNIKDLLVRLNGGMVLPVTQIGCSREN